MRYVPVERFAVDSVLFERFNVPVQIFLCSNVGCGIKQIRVNNVSGMERKIHWFVNQKFLWKRRFILVRFFSHVFPAFCKETNCFSLFYRCAFCKRSFYFARALTVRTIALIEFGWQYTVMDALVDDVGSFPLPPSVDRETFDKAYCLARNAIIHGRDPRQDEFLSRNFCVVTLDAFKKKCLTGLDVVNYPQQYNALRQVGDVVHLAMEKGTFVVDEAQAVLPEVHLIREEAKRLSEELGKKILLRVSLFGPLELYLKEVGAVAYRDVLEGFAETVRRFAKNAILDLKHVETAVVSLDEPSFGFADVAAESDVLRGVLERAFDFQGAVRQIHLHSSLRLPDLLSVKNIDVVSFEYAASPRNIEGVSRRMLEDADKQIRVGVSRTDIDSILAELHDRGVVKPTAEQLVEDEAVIRKRFVAAKAKYGDRLAFTGPDCGLGGWPSQEAAQLLLARTVKAVKGA
jgi:5-methyltetrahydropteroyltriglutamate--homocysteine methyltransferase